MTAKSKRTNPLDRDGDGKPGGSLPGNQTAPMAWTRDEQRLIAKLQLAQVTLDPAFTNADLADEVAGWSDETVQQVEAFADAMTAEGRYQDESGDERNADGSPIELPPVLSRALIGDTDATTSEVQPTADPAHPIPGATVQPSASVRSNDADFVEPADTAQVRAADEPSWTRDNAAILLKLAEAGIEIDTTKPAALAEETLVDWSNEDAHAAEIFADKKTAEGSHMDEEGGDWLDADLNPIAVPAVLEPYLFRNVEQGDTFDAEQVAAASHAGEGAVIAEEGETVADLATATAALDDGLVNIPTDTAPVAVRLHELRILVTARRLYKSPEGYSSNYGPPYIDQATVDAWIAAGLAEDVPTAGNMGGVRVTSEGRSALNRAPTDEAA